MLRSAVSKVMWVGRATVFMVGLAVILALVFGVASTALGKNGQAFILGKTSNTATKVTGLIGKVATGSALVVKNPSGGSALDLSVGDPTADPSTKSVAPMKVDSQAMVANLNSDQLDGLDSTALQRKVSGECAVGSSIRSIGANGGVACETDDDSAAIQVGAFREELAGADKSSNEQGDLVSYTKVKDIPNEILSRDADTFDGKDSAAFASSSDLPGFDSQSLTSITALPMTFGLATPPQPANVASITVTAPVEGFVILTGSGVFVNNITNSASSSAWLTTTSQGIDPARHTYTSASGNVPFSLTRVFPASAGEHTFYMTGRGSTGSSANGASLIDRASLTGIFVKTQL